VSCVSRVSVHHYASIQRSIRGIYPPPRLGLWEAEVAELQLTAESRATSNPSFVHIQCMYIYIYTLYIYIYIVIFDSLSIYIILYDSIYMIIFDSMCACVYVYIYINVYTNCKFMHMSTGDDNEAPSRIQPEPLKVPTGLV
jgi:hypothetical protein